MNMEGLVARLRRTLAGDCASDINPERALLCHTPHVAPRAYFHTVFPGVGEETIQRIEALSGVAIPRAYARLLQGFNGAILFSGAMSLYGIVESFTRNLNVHQPYDLLEYNHLSRPVYAKPEDFFIGGMKSDGSLLFLEGDAPTVFRRERGSRDVLNSWVNIDAMLDERMAALEKLFDEHGRKKDPNASTVPVPMKSRTH